MRYRFDILQIPIDSKVAYWLNGGMCVYLLQECATYDFKIGRTGVDVISVLSTLEQCVDLSRSLYIDCDGLSDEEVEKKLHHRFDDYRFTHPAGGRGSTEWFQRRCFNAVCRYIERQRDVFGCSELRKCADLSRPEPAFVPYPNFHFGWRKSRDLLIKSVKRPSDDQRIYDSYQESREK